MKLIAVKHKGFGLNNYERPHTAIGGMPQAMTEYGLISTFNFGY